MTRLHADQLPADLRRRLGLDPKPGRAKPSRADIGLSDPCPGHCGCTRAFPNALEWEKHAMRTGCRHWRIDLPQEAP